LYSYRDESIIEPVKTLVCPHCHTQVLDTAHVCTGCGAEVVRGLSRRGRSFVGLLFVGLAVLIGAVVLRALEIAYGAPPLPSPKAEYGLFVIAAFVAVFVVPYVAGTRFARLLWRSRIRFYRTYQHQ
jgi:zinc-ribbon domain